MIINKKKRQNINKNKYHNQIVCTKIKPYKHLYYSWVFYYLNILLEDFKNLINFSKNFYYCPKKLDIK